jgi:hypothetical protein
MAKRRVTVHLDAGLVAEVRAEIGPADFVSGAVTEAVELWLASKRAGNVPAEPLNAGHEPQGEPWSNAYRPPRSVRA